MGRSTKYYGFFKEAFSELRSRDAKLNGISLINNVLENIENIDIFILKQKLDFVYFENLIIDDYYRITKKIHEELNEENFIKDIYEMYLTLLPLMVRKEIEYQTFKEFLEKNKPEKKIEQSKITNKTDEEILDEINKFNFN